MIKHFLLIFSATFLFFGAAQAYEPEVSDIIESPTNTYKIEQELGEGAFGKVFQVKDRRGKKYAMKWYKDQPGIEGFAQFLSEGEREFAIGQILHHPNIIASHEFFSDSTGENHFLILDFVEGKTLHNTPRKSLSAEHSINCARKLNEAMLYAYENGYIHLDLHSGNLMIDSRSNLKVIDLASFFSWDELYELYGEAKQPKGIHPEPLESTIDRKFAPKRAKVLKQFLKMNPKILERSEQLMGEKAISMIMDRVKKSFLPYWFDWATEAEIGILLKSDMETEARLDLRGSIKRISWEYSEADIEKRKSIPLDPYLERLGSLFTH